MATNLLAPHQNAAGGKRHRKNYPTLVRMDGGQEGTPDELRSSERVVRKLQIELRRLLALNSVGRFKFNGPLGRR
jgi:hypothetical protein